MLDEARAVQNSNEQELFTLPFAKSPLHTRQTRFMSAFVCAGGRLGMLRVFSHGSIVRAHVFE